MRRAALIIVLVWAAPLVAAGQATVGDEADAPVMPEPPAELTEAEGSADEPSSATQGAEAEAPATTEAERASAGEGPTAGEAAPDDRGAPPDDGETITIVHTPADVPREAEETPILESWWFWIAISTVVLGITAAVIVAVTTDDPASGPTDPTMMGLSLRF